MIKYLQKGRRQLDQAELEFSRRDEPKLGEVRREDGVGRETRPATAEHGCLEFVDVKGNSVTVEEKASLEGEGSWRRMGVEIAPDGFEKGRRECRVCSSVGVKSVTSYSGQTQEGTLPVVMLATGKAPVILTGRH